jgi:hypothetical protein
MEDIKNETFSGEVMTHRPLDEPFAIKIFKKTKSNKYGKIIIYLCYIIYFVIGFRTLIFML